MEIDNNKCCKLVSDVLKNLFFAFLYPVDFLVQPDKQRPSTKNYKSMILRNYA